MCRRARNGLFFGVPKIFYLWVLGLFEIFYLWVSIFYLWVPSKTREKAQNLENRTPPPKTIFYLCKDGYIHICRLNASLRGGQRALVNRRVHQEDVGPPRVRTLKALTHRLRCLKKGPQGPQTSGFRLKSKNMLRLGVMSA